MVLGGGRHQLPLIRRAAERDIETVLVDYLPNAPGRAVATYPTLADATDAVEAIRIGREYGIDGVITTGTDIPIRTMAAVASSLDLPTYLDEESAFVATDKEAMARTLSSFGVIMARRETVVRGADRRGSGFPVVVKPADSQGQRGISTVHVSTDLPEALERAWAASGTDRAVIEEFIEGPELTANAWLHRGEVSLLMVNDRITFNPRPYIGIAFQHRYPSVAASGFSGEVADVVVRVGRAYRMETGPLYIQMIITDEGPVVVEAAARVGGGHESRLVFHINGWRVDDSLIDLALGSGSEAPPALPDRAHALVNFILGSAGSVSATPIPKEQPGVAEMSWYVNPGDTLSDVTNSLGRVGYFIGIGGDAGDLAEVTEAYYRSLVLPGSDGRNLVLTPSGDDLNRP